MAFVPAVPVAGFTAALSSTSHLRSGSRASAPATAPVRRVSMVAAEPTRTATVLSFKAKELLSYLRAHKSIFRPGVGFTATHLALYRKNDTGRCFVPAEELETNAYMLPGRSVAQLILEQQEEILDSARAAALKAAPALANDETLKDILFYDLWYYLRVVSYAAAVTSTDFIDENNLGMMKMFYDEISMPAAAVASGFASMRSSVVSQVKDPKLAESTATCFDALSSFLAA